MKDVYSFAALMMLGFFLIFDIGSTPLPTGCQNPHIEYDTAVCYLTAHASSSATPGNLHSWKLIDLGFAGVENPMEIEMIGTPKQMEKATAQAARHLRESLRKAGYRAQEVKVATLIRDAININGDPITLFRIRIGIKLVSVDSGNIPSLCYSFILNNAYMNTLERVPYSTACTSYDNPTYVDTFQYETIY